MDRNSSLLTNSTVVPLYRITIQTSTEKIYFMRFIILNSIYTKDANGCRESIFDRIRIHPHPTPWQSRDASVCAHLRARGVFTPPRVIPPNSVIQGRE